MNPAFEIPDRTWEDSGTEVLSVRSVQGYISDSTRLIANPVADSYFPLLCGVVLSWSDFVW